VTHLHMPFAAVLRVVILIVLLDGHIGQVDKWIVPNIMNVSSHNATSSYSARTAACTHMSVVSLVYLALQKRAKPWTY
jgi:hypothetical protein